jgi:hypothetical protein
MMSRTCVWVIAAVAASGPAWAQTVPAPETNKQPGAEASKQPLPKAEEVFEQYITAIGGREALGKLTNRVLKGTVEVPKSGYQGLLTFEQAPPNKLHVTAEVPGLRTDESGFDGTTGWTRDPDRGGRIVPPGPELETLKDSADFLGEANYKNRYKSVEVVDRMEFEGRPAYKIHATLLDGSERSLFFDTETHLLLGAEMQREGPGGKPYTFTVAMTDYKEAGGTKYPSKIVQRAEGKEPATIAFKTIEVNVAKAPSFEVPEDIKKLDAPKK